MSHRIEKSVTINAPKELVWDLMQNVTRRTEWDARVTSARSLSPAPIRRGSRLEIITRMNGINFPATMEYVSWNPPYRCAVKTVGSSKGIETVVGSWKLEENDRGETTWTTTVVLTPEKTLLGRLISFLMAGTFEKMTVQSQKNLKRLAEQEYAKMGRPAVAEPELVG